MSEQRYYTLHPEVAGQLGEGTKFVQTNGVATVTDVHYVFYGWGGDEVIKSHPYFLFTVGLSELIQRRGLSGISFEPVRTSKSEFFLDMYGPVELPCFVGSRIHGTAGIDDFGLDKYKLVASSRAIELIAPYCRESISRICPWTPT